VPAVADVLNSHTFTSTRGSFADVQHRDALFPGERAWSGVSTRDRSRRLDSAAGHRHPEVDAAMRTLFVVVAAYWRRTRSSWRWPRMTIQSRHSVRTVLTQRSAYALARDEHLSCRQFDDEEHVELLEGHGVRREEVRGQHANEGTPSRSGCSVEQVRDRVDAEPV
jgi:hypothetical protein